MLTTDTGPDSVLQWFARHGPTDTPYLQAHFSRFQQTFEFASFSMGAVPMDVLDVGAHWLHQAFFFANAGHRLVCCDTPSTLALPSVSAAAQAMNASLVTYTRLDKGEGLRDLPENSIDRVLFTEILEHLSFNPVEMWREIYRVLRPNGRIIVSTPNSLYLPHLTTLVDNLIRHGRTPPTVHSIFESGTYGHHWKEFNSQEIGEYFATLSPDFIVSREQSLPGNVEHCNQLLQQARQAVEANHTPEAVCGYLVLMLAEQGLDLTSQHLLVEVTLDAKRHGIVATPPWTVA